MPQHQAFPDCMRARSSGANLFQSTEMLHNEPRANDAMSALLA